MAINEPNVSDNVTFINLGNKTPTDEKAADQPAPEGGEAPAPEKTAGQDKSDAPPAPEEKTPEPSEKDGLEDKGGDPPVEKTARRGRPPKAEKAPAQEAGGEQDNRPPWEKPTEPKISRGEKAAATRKANKEKQKSQIDEPEASEKARLEAQAKIEAMREASRSRGPEQIVHINLSELHAFKNHPFGVRDDAEMKALVESVKGGGVNQPALVRPREDGGYEIIAGHRRQKASELAGYLEMPCIVREMTDDEAILAMTDDNLRQRSEILPSEKAVSLKMQVEAIKHQGARDTSGQIVQKDLGKRSIDLVGERNNMNAKQVQRYIRLTELVPDLQKAVDENRLGFTPAVEISFIRPKNQNFIAVSMDSEDTKPSLSQAQRLKELDGKGQLNSDVIDGILCEQKKEVDKVIISGAELNKYFGKEKTPQEMKNQIIKLLDEWAGKEKTLTAPEKKDALEK